MMEIREICKLCGPDSTSCGQCNLTGSYARWTITLPINVFYSHQILEEIDTAEYNALTGTQKDGVKLILMCGLVDLNEGRASYAHLLSWFGAGSATVANLAALLE